MTTGTLFVVATPIGNVDDISLRARTVLAEVALVAAEDTRHTGALLSRLGISSRLLSCHEHNEEERLPEILAVLQEGKNVALVSDAGTPLVSDPGYRLVSAAVEQGITVSPIPGCSAMMAAVSVAALPTDRLMYEGFLPATLEKRRARLSELSSRTETLIFYESVHRIGATLADLVLVFGPDRKAIAARELTKLHETIYRGSLSDLVEQVATTPGADKGEYTLVVAGAPASVDVDGIALDRTLSLLLGYVGVKQAAELAAKLLKVRKNDAYRRALELREDSDEGY